MTAAHNLTAFLPGFIERQIRVLGFVLFWVALVSVYFLMKRLPGFVQGIRARSWPTAEGRIETINVKEFGQQALGELGYSFSAKGGRYSGYFSWQFGDEQQAWDYVTELKGRPVIVRYKDESPDVSTLRNVDQSQTDLRGAGLLKTIWTAFLGTVKNRF